MAVSESEFLSEFANTVRNRGLESVPIPTYLAFLRTKELQDTGARAESWRKTRCLYQAIRGLYHPATVGDAMDLLRQGTIPSSLVEVWAKEGKLSAPLEYGAASHGYPGLQKPLDIAIQSELENALVVSRQ